MAAKTQEELLQENNELLREFIRTNRGGGGSEATPRSGGGSSSGGGVSGKAGAFQGFIDSSVDGLAKLAKGSFSAGDALGIITGAMGKVPVVGATMGKVTETLGSAGIKLGNDLNEAGKSGMSFNNDIGNYAKSLGGARMSSDEFLKTLDKNSNGLTVMGMTVDRASKNYMAMAKDLQENPVARQLQETGISAAEMNGFLTQQLTNRRTLDITDAKARKEAIESTLALTVEMDALARQTGKSRQQQMDDLKAQQSKAEVQAALMQMGEEGRKNFDKMQTAMGPLGKSAQDLASEIATGGVRTKEGANALAAMGPAGAQFTAAVKQQMEARTPAEKAAAEAAMKKAQDDITAYQRSKQYLDMVRYDTSEVGMARRKQFQENQFINQQVAKENENKGKTKEEADKKQKGEIASAQAGKPTAAIGGTDQGSKVGRGMNELKILSQDIGAGLGITADKINKIAGAGVDQLKSINNKLPNGLGKYGTAEQKNAQLGDITNKALGAAGLNFNAASANPENKPAGYQGPGKKNSFADGTLGQLGSLFGDFGKGTPAMLHGKEAVITEKQMENMANGLFGNVNTQVSKMGVPQGMPNMTKELEKVTANISKPQMAMPDFGSITSTIQSKMAEMTKAMPMPDIAAKAAAKPATSTTATPTPNGGYGKSDSTLNDVVSALNDLNKQMGQLISQQEESSRSQLRATKANSGNRLAA